jgi:hypothetical protein
VKSYCFCFRLQQLKTYGENEWKKRIQTTNDANEFTVEGKLRQAGMFLFKRNQIHCLEIFFLFSRKNFYTYR